jgi:hypothetical protein
MLIDKLDLYLNENYYPFHMPGSKRSDLLRSDLAYKRDLTEIENFDNLNDPKSIFVEMQDKIAELYKVRKSIISTNGSTSGILSAIRALTRKNKNILIQRSSHKSVFNACELNELRTSYVNIKTNSNLAIKDIDYDDLIYKLSLKDYAALVITSPSYEGYRLDLERIYKLCKKLNVKLLVDMAHGSHLLLDGTYKNTFDVAITSFHKNLSALTPGAAVLINDLELYDEIKRNMAIFQTSSPSYLILQSIDEMLDKFSSFYGLNAKLTKMLDKLYELKLENLYLIDDKHKDKSKILISTKNTNISGEELQKLLRKEKIEIEMSYPDYALLIATIFDSKEAFDRLALALLKIDKKLSKQEEKLEFFFNEANKKYEIYEALNYKRERVKLRDSLGRLAADFIYAYPPGIPIIVPGEIIDEKVLSNIYYFLKNKINVNIKEDFIHCIIDK